MTIDSADSIKFTMTLEAKVKPSSNNGTSSQSPDTSTWGQEDAKHAQVKQGQGSQGQHAPVAPVVVSKEQLDNANAKLARIAQVVEMMTMEEATQQFEAFTIVDKDMKDKIGLSQNKVDTNMRDILEEANKHLADKDKKYGGGLIDQRTPGARPRYRFKSAKEKKLGDLLDAAVKSFQAAMDIVSLNIREKGSPALKALYDKYEQVTKEHDETLVEYSNKLRERGVTIAAPDLLTIVQTQMQLKVKIGHTDNGAVATVTSAPTSVSTVTTLASSATNPFSSTTTTTTTTVASASAAPAPVDSALFLEVKSPEVKKPLFSAPVAAKKKTGLLPLSQKETDYSKTVASFAQKMTVLDAEAAELGIEMPPEVQAIQDVHSVLGKRVTTFEKQLKEVKAAEDEAFKKSDAAKRVEENRPLAYFASDVKNNRGWYINPKDNLSISAELQKVQYAIRQRDPNYVGAKHYFAYSVNKNCIVHCARKPNDEWDFVSYYQVCTHEEAKRYFDSISGKGVPNLAAAPPGSSNYETVNL